MKEIEDAEEKNLVDSIRSDTILRYDLELDSCNPPQVVGQVVNLSLTPMAQTRLQMVCNYLPEKIKAFTHHTPSLKGNNRKSQKIIITWVLERSNCLLVIYSH